MDIITLEDIRESSRLKEKACKSCMEQLKGIFSDVQLQEFEGAFHSAVDGYILRRKD